MVQFLQIIVIRHRKNKPFCTSPSKCDANEVPIDVNGSPQSLGNSMGKPPSLRGNIR